MAIDLNLKQFNELLQIHKERQLAMKELSDNLGIDISFNDEEVMEFALQEFQKQIDKKINQEVILLMKSLFS